MCVAISVPIDTIWLCAYVWKTNGKSSHGESGRKRTSCLVIISVLFTGDPADHFGKFGSPLEEVDNDSYYRHSFPVALHLEDDSIRNGMSSVKSERVIHSLFGGGLSEEMESLCYDLPTDRCPRFSILILDNQQITFNWTQLTWALSALNDTFCSLFSLRKSMGQDLKSIIGTSKNFLN